jgi:protein TonB
MMLARAYLEPPARRFARWSGSAGMIAALHVTAGVLAFLFWPASPPETQQPGAIMVELEAQAGEATHDLQEIAEQPVSEASAPPPSPTESTEQTPPEEAAAGPQPAEPAPEKVAEAPAEPVPEAQPVETPPVEEAPLAPEPEVTLPKEVPKEKPVEQAEPKKEEPVKKPKEKAEKTRETKAAEKSDSKQKQQAASAAKGQFNPNPIYRPNPVYPAGARAQKIQGRVVVAYSVSPSGSVSNARVVSASPPGVFNAAALAAVRQWRFKPSAQGGSRTSGITFRLK